MVPLPWLNPAGPHSICHAVPVPALQPRVADVEVIPVAERADGAAQAANVVTVTVSEFADPLVYSDETM